MENSLVMKQHPNGSSMPVLNPNKFVVKRLKRATQPKKATLDSPKSQGRLNADQVDVEDGAVQQ